MSTEPPAADWPALVDRLLAHSRRVNAAIVATAFGCYGLAYYVWTLGQSIGAIVIATFGYLLFRSMRKISFNLACQAQAQQPGYPILLRCLDADSLARPREEILQRLRRCQEEEAS